MMLYNHYDIFADVYSRLPGTNQMFNKTILQSLCLFIPSTGPDITVLVCIPVIQHESLKEIKTSLAQLFNCSCSFETLTRGTVMSYQNMRDIL